MKRTSFAIALFVITLALGLPGAKAGKACSIAFARAFPTATTTSDSLVCYTQAENDSIALALDEMALRIRLLEADLLEGREEGSGFQAGDWLLGKFKHPALWFCIGLVTGIAIVD